MLDARLERVRAAMSEAQLDALLVYTNNTRAAGVSWLTGFVPYWSEALLVVPRARAPVLVVALTYRVKSWIERMSRVAEVIHTPRIGLEAARMIAAAKADAAVGIADLDGLAAGIVDDLREGGPRLTPERRDSAVRTAARRGRSGGDRAGDEGRRDRAARARAGGGSEPRRRSSPRSKGRHACSAPRRSISPPRPISRATGACGASRARRPWASASRCARPLPTRAHGSASCARFGAGGERRGGRRAVRRGGGAASGRARFRRVFILAGRGLPDRAAARAADGIAHGRAEPAGAAVAGVGAGVPRDRRPAVLLGAPALLGARGEAASLLVEPLS